MCGVKILRFIVILRFLQKIQCFGNIPEVEHVASFLLRLGLFTVEMSSTALRFLDFAIIPVNFL